MANAFWNGELEAEIREGELKDYAFLKDGDREKAMEVIDAKRAVSIYQHTQCSEECRKRGMRILRYYPISNT